MQAATVLFATTARVIGGAARARGWSAPGFRSPPRLAGAARTLRRAADGSTTVAIRLEGRPWLAVVADMIEGVVATNELVGEAADDCRTSLWAAVDRAGDVLGPRPGAGPTRAPNLVGPARLHRGPPAIRAA